MYEDNSKAFLDYIQLVNTTDSEREAAAHSLKAKSIFAKAHAVLRGYNAIEQSLPRKRGPSLSRQSRAASLKTSSSVSSTSSHARAEMTLARCNTELEFARRAANLKRAKAETVLQQANLEADIEFLEKSKMAAVATAELEALAAGNQLDLISVENCSVSERTSQYVADQFSREYQPDYVDYLPIIEPVQDYAATVQPVQPAHVNSVSTQLFIKKKLCAY